MHRKSRFFNKKNILLSIVALILVAMLSVGATYSWIDDLTEVKISSDDNGTNTPLTVGKDIHAEYEVGKNEKTEINLGRVIEKSQEQTDKEVIKDEGYFYESGAMHLSPCYGDGNNFYFAKKGATGYRQATHDDYNVNFISVTLKISSPNAKTEFWFKDIPHLYFDSEKKEDKDFDQAMRVSITTDGITHVYTNSKIADNVYNYYTLASAGDTASTEMTDGRLFDNYTYTDANYSSTRKQYGNTLFTVGKGETKNVNIKIWLEDGALSSNKLGQQTVSDIDFGLVSSYSKKRTIRIENKTTGSSADTWMFNDNAKIYVAIPAARATSSGSLVWEENVSYWDITNTLKTNKVASIEIPAYYNDEELYVFRCNSSGWNKSDSGTKQRSDYKIYSWNFWQTNLPDTFDTETYTMYGATYNEDVSKVYGTGAYHNVENRGYGTWSGVMKIYFKSNNPSGTTPKGPGVNYAYYFSEGGCNLFIEDYSDYAQNEHVYYYTMSPTSTNSSGSGNTIWEGYIPTASKKIEFRYSYLKDNSNFFWGYTTQTDATHDRASSLTGGYERPDDANTYCVTKVDANGTKRGQGMWLTQTESVTEPQTTTQATTTTQPSGDTDSMTGYTTSSNFVLKYGNTTSRFYTKSGEGTIYKASVTFNAKETKYCNIQIDGGTYSGRNFGLGTASVYDIPRTDNLIINSSRTNTFGLYSDEAATYVVSFSIKNTEQTEIEIRSIKKAT